MNNNKNSSVGQIIKGIAYFVAIAGLLGGFIIAVAASDVAEYYGFSSFFLFFYFALMSVFSASLLYGFGTLISDVNDLKMMFNKGESNTAKSNVEQKEANNTVVIEHGTNSNTKVVTHQADVNTEKEMFNDLPKL